MKFREFLARNWPQAEVRWTEFVSFVEAEGRKKKAKVLIQPPQDIDAGGRIELVFAEGVVVFSNSYLRFHVKWQYDIVGEHLRFTPKLSSYWYIRAKEETQQSKLAKWAEEVVERFLKLHQIYPVELALPERVVHLPIPPWVELRNPYGEYTCDQIEASEMFLSEAKEAWRKFISQEPFQT